MKVAIVCDWLTNVGGAERVLKAVHVLYPNAPIYTSKYDKKGIDWFLDADVRAGWLQIFPTRLRRILGPLRQAYFNHLDLSEYDVIISVTGAEAKSVKKGNAVHFCYCHVPTQYYWQFYDSYVENPGFGLLNPIVRFFFKLFVKPLKKADYKAAQKPDYFITISEYASGLIEKYYNRESIIIFPPVNVDKFLPKQPVEKSVENFYITTSRQVTWKRIDLAIKACIQEKKKLVIIGDGPEHQKLEKIANDSEYIKFLPATNQDGLKKYLTKAKGYIFPSLEPFGIAPVEALAAGCPVIAFKKGGALDYIRDRENGTFFEKQTVKSLSEALQKFDKMKFNKKKVMESSLAFDGKIFEKKLKDFINEKTKD